MTTLISPSILAADFSKLGDEVREVTEGGAAMIHLDIMDGHFVPNITFGPDVVKALRPHSDLPFDTHLMIAPSAPYLEAFAEAGSDIITVHPEADPHIHRSLQRIRDLGKKAGVAINPGTPLAVLDPLYELVDLILVMSVNPGFGGQKFLTSALPRISHIAENIDNLGLSIILEVDGGINPTTASQVIGAGANALVAGTAIFRSQSSSYKTAIENLKNQ